MLLVLDVGNTNIKTGVYSDGQLKYSWRMTTDNRRTSDEYGIKMESFFHHIGISPDRITGIIMSSVNPTLNYTIEHMCSLYFNGIEPLLVSDKVNSGLINRYDTPSKLGSDRLCNSIAAYKIACGPCINIDFGTATTFNVISENAEFLGGAIYPGIRVATEALTNNAALLPETEIAKPNSVIATNTTDAIQSGIINGYVGMIEHMIKLINEERGVHHMVIATGGMSKVIASETSVIDIVVPTLTLDGLAIIAAMNGINA